MPHDSFFFIVKLILQTSLIRKVKQLASLGTPAPLCKFCRILTNADFLRESHAA
jgi:hypothetical protein